MSCSAAKAKDSTANMWGVAAGSAVAGAAVGSFGAGAGAVPGAATGFLMGGAGAGGVELFEQGQCAYNYVSQRSACNDYPQSDHFQEDAFNQSGSVIQLSPVYIYPEGDPRNFQDNF